ncbi:hypothetical protein, partial [Pseudomonas silesiensis]|uniref:hypothetical protein n=1 Tax=Pseudomonas silesiensis TaxID=1853130 RepID=UPI0034D6EAB5
SRTVTPNAPLSGGGNLGSNISISISPANGSTDGYLASGDWTTFNNKAPINSPTFTGTVGGITASMVGLANVDNTSDANKPVSTAT